MRKIAQGLICLLAVIAAVVAAGLAMGKNMWLFIIAYWIVLTAKNIVDWIAGMKN